MYSIGDILCIDALNGSIYPYKVVFVNRDELYDKFGPCYFLEDIIDPSNNTEMDRVMINGVIRDLRYARCIYETDPYHVPREYVSDSEIDDVIMSYKRQTIF